MIRFLLIALVYCFPLLSIAQDSLLIRYAGSITREDLKKHLEIVASDAFEGRETGEKGQKMAAEYIRKHFEDLQLTGPVTGGSNPFYQEFNLVRSSWDSFTVQAGKRKLGMFEHFAPYGSFEIEQQALPVVFAGYGLNLDAYDDYAGLAVEGKAVVVLAGEPQNEDGTFFLSKTAKPTPQASGLAKIRKAIEKKAAMVIYVYESDAEFASRNVFFKQFAANPSLSFPTKEQRVQVPLIYTSPTQAAAILGISTKALQKRIKALQKESTNPGTTLQSTIAVQAKRKTEMVSTENVLGYLEGTDKKDELLVVTAHYDHIGINPLLEGDQINNGADDDGSGTVAVMELAEAFVQAKKDGHGPRRSILFMTVTGEEKGLLGSQYYSENPVFPLASTVANLNIDMIGRVDDKHQNNPNYIYLIGTDMLSSELHQLSEETAKTYAPNLEIDYTYNDKDDPNRFYYRSDHYNFAKHNIPVIFYFNGTHEDYHGPGDEVEKIHFEKMEAISRLIFATAWKIANREERLVVDKLVEE
jgi:hypothetical protein